MSESKDSLMEVTAWCPSVCKTTVIFVELLMC